MKYFDLTTGDDGYDEIVAAGTEETAISSILKKHGLAAWPDHWELEEFEFYGDPGDDPGREAGP